MTRVWDPNLYEQTSSVQRELATDFCQRSLSLRGDEHILDVGCGDGFMTHQLAQQLPQGYVLGIDPGAAMIASANETYASPQVDFQCLAASEIDFQQKFDCVVSFSALMWEVQQAQAAQRLLQALKPGGKLLLFVWPWLDAAWSPAEIVKQLPHWQQHFKDFDHGFQCSDVVGYQQLLTQAGFSIDSAEAIFNDARIADEAQYAMVISSFLPHLAHLQAKDNALRQAFLAETCTQFALMTGKDVEGKFFFPMRYIEIVAYK